MTSDEILLNLLIDIENTLNSIEARPSMYGDVQAIEFQYVLLLDHKRVITRPTRGRSSYYRDYQYFCKRQNCGVGYLSNQYSVLELIQKLKLYRATYLSM